MAASRAMLDEEHGFIEDKDEKDSNFYFGGRIHLHNVVIACLPLDEYGTNAAATVAINMLRTFKNIKFGLLVGVGGALADPQKGDKFDLRLGDVVVSSAKNTSGGVIQYDIGKQQTEGKFESKGMLNRPPTILRTALGSLFADHEINDSRVPAYIQEALCKHSKLEKSYKLPTATEDHLFKSSYAHATGIPNCSSCDQSKIVYRSQRSDSVPRIFYGTILSGNLLIRDSVTRDLLRERFQQHDPLCIEMEAAGLMNNLPSIVIRGICDYADSHKNDVWHRYAALAAAAFAKELLLFVSLKGTKNEEAIKLGTLQKLQVGVDGIKHNLQEQAQQQKTRYEDEGIAELLRALNTSAYDQFKNFNADAVEGTCQWVLEHRKYKKWDSIEKNDLLWISADPGCGKSVLSKYLVDEVLPKPHSRSICYFFFKDNSDQRTLQTALCAILHQLFTDQPRLAKLALAQSWSNSSRLIGNSQELWRIFIAAATDPTASPITCVIDALDEAAERGREELIGMLRIFYDKATRTTEPKLKILVTSRPDDTVKRHFKLMGSQLPEICLQGEKENDRINEEINLVIDKWLTRLAKDVNLTALSQERLRKQLLDMKHRTYLWLELSMEGIRQRYKYSNDRSSETIELLPDSVMAAYDHFLYRVIGRLETKSRERANTVLSIVAGAKTPFTIRELHLAWNVFHASNTVYINDLLLDEDEIAETVRHLTGLFIFENCGTIYLIHQTAKEFLLNHAKSMKNSASLWKVPISVISIERTMANICVQLLSRNFIRDCVKVPEAKACKDENARQEVSLGELLSPILHSAASHITRESFQDAMEYSIIEVWNRLPAEQGREWTRLKIEEIAQGLLGLYKYAASCWVYHVNASESAAGDSIWTTVLTLYDDLRCSKSVLWIRQTWEYLLEDMDIEFFHGNSDIYLAIIAEHFTVLECRRNFEEFDIEGRDEQQKTPLMFAAMIGSTQAVEWLLRKKANIHACCASGRDALIYAVEAEHANIASMLLKQGADPNSEGCCAHPLLAAAAVGMIDVVEQLLNQGVEANLKGGYYGNALQSAAYFGHSNIVEILLRAGANPNAKGGIYGSALQAASFAGHDSIVQTLIAWQADVNQKGGKYGNALQAALYNPDPNQLGITELLSAGADANACDQINSQTQITCHKEDEQVLRWLTRSGRSDPADMNETERDELAVWCSLDSNLTMAERCQVMKMLDAVASNTISNDDINSAIRERNLDGTLHEVKKFVTWRRMTKSSFQLACYSADWYHVYNAALSLYEQLDEHEHILHQTFLMHQAREGSERRRSYIPEVMEIESWYFDIRSASCFREGSSVTRSYSLDNSDRSSDRLRTPLQIACDIGHAKLVNMLITKGADMDVEGGEYFTVIQAAAARGNAEVVQQLINRGAAVNKTGGPYGCALIAALQNNHLDIARQLLNGGADLNIRPHGRSLLQDACAAGNLVDAEFLLNANADINYKPGKDGTALQAAIKCCSPVDVCEFLLTNGADVNALAGKHGLPIYTAASLEEATTSINMLGMLLGAGALVNAEGWYADLQGETQWGTSLLAAVSCGKLDAVKRLIAAGARPEIKGDFGNATETAKFYEQPKIIAWFERYEAGKKNTGETENPLNVMIDSILTDTNFVNDPDFLSAPYSSISEEVESMFEKIEDLKDHYAYLRACQPADLIDKASLRRRNEVVGDWDNFNGSDFEQDYAERASSEDWEMDSTS